MRDGGDATSCQLTVTTCRHRQRFRLNRTGAQQQSLVISRLRIDDAGLYTCIEDAGLGDRHLYRLTVHGLHVRPSATTTGVNQSCSQYSVIQVPVQVPVLESQVPVPMPVPMSQVQVQVPVLRFQVPVPVQVPSTTTLASTLLEHWTGRRSSAEDARIEAP